MLNAFFQFQQFRIEQAESGMKVTTDACLFGAWVATQLGNPSRILDIGAGTGLLSLMLAQKTSDSIIDAIEIDASASIEARNNFISSPWKDRLQLTHQAIQSFNAVGRFDVIVSNPPFYEGSQQGNSASRNKALHETTLTQEELFDAFKQHLRPEGRFFILYPEHEFNQFERLVSATFYCVEKVVVRNKVADSVFRIMGTFQKKSKPPVISELIIRHADQRYTDDFWRLLSAYYLPYNNPALKQ